MEAREMVATFLDVLAAFSKAEQEQIIEMIQQEFIARRITEENVLLGSEEQ